MTTPFEFAVNYVIANEGGYSDHPTDGGGQTMWGITRSTAEQFGLNFDELTLAQAKSIYRQDYWRFDGIRDRRLAAKCLDVTVNFGLVGGTRVLQRACGAEDDGVYGPNTEAKLSNPGTDEMLERIAAAAADRYVDICRDKPTQLVFLKGWIRRAIRQPPRRQPQQMIENCNR